MGVLMIKQLKSVAYNIMQRDINLRTPASQKTDNQSIRLVDSRGKRLHNNKINIYSQKYSLIQNPIQRQQPKVIKLSDKKESEHLTINLSNSRSRPAIVITRKQEIQPKQFESHQKSSIQTTSQKQISDKQGKNMHNGLTLASLKQYIEEIRIFYQAKIKQITEENAKTICQLRNLLVQQQHRIAQKQEVINKIINSDKSKHMAIKNPSIRFHLNESPSKIALFKPMNVNIHQQYFSNKVKDLQNRLKIFMDQFIQSEEQVKSKVDSIQNGLIRYFSNRITKSWFRLDQISQYFQKKCSSLEIQLKQGDKNISNTINNKNQPIFQRMLSQTNAKIAQLSKDLKSICNKQVKHETQRMQGLQTVLISLMQKVDFIQRKNFLQSSRRIENGLFFQDQDQFFYPSSQRIYEPNDEYEHFQSESQDQSSSLIKQNINNNCQTYAIVQKSKLF